MKLTVAPVTAMGATTGFCVDDGERLLTACPCCGSTLTQEGAKALVEKVEKGEFSFAALCELASLVASVSRDSKSRT